MTKKILILTLIIVPVILIVLAVVILIVHIVLITEARRILRLLTPWWRNLETRKLIS